MLVGQGALDATDEVLAVGERLGAGIVTALLGKAPCRVTSRTTRSSSGSSGRGLATT